jgi:tRNA (guanine37-N1)-methyltransferase
MRRSSHSAAPWHRIAEAPDDAQALEESVTVPDLSIRVASRADAAALAELASDTFPLACPPSTTEAAIAAFIAANFTVERMDEYPGGSRSHAPRGGGADGRPVGYSMLIAGEPGDADAATSVVARPAVELSKFYTRALAHGSGSSRVH